jgi:hypothetical protein
MLDLSPSVVSVDTEEDLVDTVDVSFSPFFLSSLLVFSLD